MHSGKPARPGRRSRWGAALAVGVLTATAAVLGVAPGVARANQPWECSAYDVNSYRACVAGVNQGTYQTVYVDAVITIEPWDTYDYTMRNRSGIYVTGRNGGGFRFSDKQQRTTPLKFDNISNSWFSNMRVEGTLPYIDRHTERCDGCAPGVELTGGGNNTFDGMQVRNVWKDGVLVLRTSGFTWQYSLIDNAGEVGLKAGFDDYSQRNAFVQINHNDFSNTRVNALALSVYGNGSRSSNVIWDNDFVNNHRAGVYTNCGGNCDGGQLLIAGPREGDDRGSRDLSILDNRISNGNCSICVGDRANGIEMDSVRNADIKYNTIRDNHGIAIYANEGSSQWPTRLWDVTITGNNIYNNRYNRIELDRNNVVKVGQVTVQ